MTNRLQLFIVISPTSIVTPEKLGLGDSFPGFQN